MSYSVSTQAKREGARIMFVALESVAKHFSHRSACNACVQEFYCEEGGRVLSLARHHTELALETVAKLEVLETRKRTTKGAETR